MDRDVLRRDLMTAMRARDAISISALRSAIAALDNAEAVPVEAEPTTSSSHIAGAVTGIGAAEAQRRQLTEADVIDILRREISERLTAAEDAEHARATAHAERLRAEAKVLAAYLAK